MAKTETNNLSVNIKVAVRIRPGKANDQEVEYDETKNTISGGHPAPSLSIEYWGFEGISSMFMIA